MIEIDFEVTGRDIDELERNAEAELLQFVCRRKTTYDLDVRSLAGHNGPYPNVVLWQATVRARVSDTDGAVFRGKA